MARGAPESPQRPALFGWGQRSLVCWFGVAVNKSNKSKSVCLREHYCSITSYVVSTMVLIVLLATFATDRLEETRCERTKTILRANNIRCKIVDGMDPQQDALRNRLFRIANVAGHYPQFFQQDDADGAIVHLGDFNTFEVWMDEVASDYTTIPDVEESFHSSSGSLLSWSSPTTLKKQCTVTEKTKSVRNGRALRPSLWRGLSSGDDDHDDDSQKGFPASTKDLSPQSLRPSLWRGTSFG